MQRGKEDISEVWRLVTSHALAKLQELASIDMLG